MEQKIFSFIHKHQLLHRGAKVLVGVSGGPDSMALLHFLYENRKEWDLELTALSVNHQLRGEAAEEDLAFVEDIAKKRGIAFHGVSLDVPAYEKKHRVSTEVAAREVRYQFFAEKMEELEADYLALGHHGDDQAETLIMKLARSASSTAFSGIPVKRQFAGGKIIRPLLAVSREEIEKYCAEREIETRLDVTNLETIYTRNYYRKHVIPLLKSKNSNLHITAQRLSETIEMDEIYLEKQAKKVLNQAVIFQSGNKSAVLDINAFLKHDQPLQRRAFQLILNYLYKTLPNQLSYIHEEQFFTLLSNREGNVQIHFPKGLQLNRAYNKLTFTFDNQHLKHTPFHEILEVPGHMRLPDGSILRSDIAEHSEEEHRHSIFIAMSEVSLPLHVRTRRPGDRMAWKGLQGTKKLKDIFIDEKIPISERNSWPLVVDNQGKIIWLIGLRKGIQESTSSNHFIHLYYDEGNQ